VFVSIFMKIFIVYYLDNIRMDRMKITGRISLFYISFTVLKEKNIVFIEQDVIAPFCT